MHRNGSPFAKLETEEKRKTNRRKVNDPAGKHSVHDTLKMINKISIDFVLYFLQNMVKVDDIMPLDCFTCVERWINFIVARVCIV